jgi:hypothetical protein
MNHKQLEKQRKKLRDKLTARIRKPDRVVPEISRPSLGGAKPKKK